MDFSQLGEDFTADFDVLRPLGSRPSPRVFLAHQRSLDRLVAIKVLADEAEDPRQRALLLDEARVLAQLKHPRLVNVYTLGGEDHVPYLAMEYVEGDSLQSRLEAGPLGLKTFFRLAIGVAQGLQYIHESGVVHGNLKPRNILIDPSGQARILDFGLAVDAMERRAPGETVTGTPAYIAPERIAGEPATRSSDLYAMGAVMLEMLTGEPPFVGSVERVLEAHRHEAPPPLRARRPELPAVLEELIAWTLEKVPVRRPPDAQSLLERLVDLASVGDLISAELLERLAHVTKPGDSVSSLLARAARGGLTPSELIPAVPSGVYAVRPALLLAQEHPGHPGPAQAPTAHIPNVSLRPLWPPLAGLALLMALGQWLAPQPAVSTGDLPPRIVACRTMPLVEAARIDVEADREVRLVAQWVPVPGGPVRRQRTGPLARDPSVTLPIATALGPCRVELTLEAPDGTRTLASVWVRALGRHARVVASRAAWRDAVNPVPTRGGVLIAGDGELTAMALDGSVTASAPLDGRPTVPLLIRPGIVVSGTDRGILAAFEPERLSPLWTHALDGPIAGTLGCDGTRAFAATADGRVEAIDLLSGREVWAQDLGAGTGGAGMAICAGPTWTPGLVLVGCVRGTLEALSDQDGKPVRSMALGAAATQRPVLAAGAAWVALSDGRIAGVDPASGVRRTDLLVGGPISGLVAAGTNALVASTAGLFRIDLSAGRVTGQALLPPAVAGPVMTDAGELAVGLSDGTVRTFAGDLTPSDTVALSCEPRALVLAGDRLLALDVQGSVLSIAHQ